MKMDLSNDVAPGLYRSVCYHSGTVNVEDGKHQRTRYGWRSINPHLGVYPPSMPSEDDAQRIRYEMADQLAEWLNGREAPPWLALMDRISETQMLDHHTGARITAIGPFIDSNPPCCQWVEDKSQWAQSRRARLMDAVQGIGRKELVR